MKTAVLVIQNAIRLLGVVLIGLGIMFWSGHSLDLVRTHMRLGEVLVGLLWVLATMGTRAGVKPALALGAIIYGFFVVMFAMRMGGILPGGAHVIVRILHLTLGLGAMGLAESIAAKVKRASA
jgi:peptidoglycan/LPS O-acetylase OafA/YrhL